MTPVSISIGSEPTTTLLTNRARGVRPSFDAISSLMIRAAEAPSVSGEELPGVIFQSISGKRPAIRSLANDVGSPASPSTVVVARIVSSWLSPAISMMSFEKSAAAASRCERAENSSSCSRLKPQRAAISSAEMPWPTRPGA